MAVNYAYMISRGSRQLTHVGRCHCTVMLNAQSCESLIHVRVQKCNRLSPASMASWTSAVLMTRSLCSCQHGMGVTTVPLLSRVRRPSPPSVTSMFSKIFLILRVLNYLCLSSCCLYYYELCLISNELFQTPAKDLK